MLYAVTPSPPAEALENPLCSRNSISTKLSLRHNLNNVTTSATSATSLENSGCELISIHPAPYTSLRDLLPPAVVNSPKPMSLRAHRGPYGPKISIRNRLVKQAAWAYLKPMSTLTDTVDGSFLRRLCLRFSVNSAVAAFVDFVDRLILLPLTRAFKRLFLSIQIRSST